jgi:predicted transcriptional regulator
MQPDVSAAALLRLLTPENRALLGIIRDRKPQSVAELASLAGRAPPNLTRTLGKLVAVGLVQMKVGRRRKAPLATARRFRIVVDPCSAADRIFWD